MDDDTLLIVGAVALGGLAIYSLKGSVKDISEPTGAILTTANEFLRTPLELKEGVKTAIQMYETNLEKNKLIAEGERIQTIFDIPKTNVIVQAKKVAEIPTKSNIGMLQSAIAIEKFQTPKSLGGYGMLPPAIINLGSKPIKTQQLSLYSKIDNKLGGILPAGVPSKLPTLFNKKK